MATSILVPISEYLKTVYRPDCDYVDGEVQERNLGEVPHSGLQSFFVAIFFNHRKTWGVRALPEQRVQVSKSRFRIPDVCVLKLGASPDPIVRTPPLLCIEILSPEDTFSRTQERIADYTAMGVEHVWLIDPIRRRIWVTESKTQRELEADALTIPVRRSAGPGVCFLSWNNESRQAPSTSGFQISVSFTRRTGAKALSVSHRCSVWRSFPRTTRL